MCLKLMLCSAMCFDAMTAGTTVVGDAVASLGDRPCLLLVHDRPLLSAR